MHPMTYVYLILLISDALWLFFAVIVNDKERLPFFVVCLPLFFIGFSSNWQLCYGYVLDNL